MPVEIIMPKVDMDMASGKVLAWHVSPGEKVEKGNPLFDIETDKAAMEVEAPESGIVHFLVDEGTEVPIGQPVAWLFAEDEELRKHPSGNGKNPSSCVNGDKPAEKAGSNSEIEKASPFAQEDFAGKVRATPLARFLAHNAGIDVAIINGTGPRGRVQENDVKSFLEDTAPVSATAIQDAPNSSTLAVSRTTGGTGIPVVLIHGFASDAKSWAPLEAHLNNRPIIRVELPGHGKSPKHQVDGFSDLAAQVRRTFDSLNLVNAHLVGHSLGGALALALADTHSRTFASLTMIAPAGLGPKINADSLNGIVKATRPESLRPWLKTLVADESLITNAYARTVMLSRSEPQLRAMQAAMADALFPDGTQAFDLKAELNRIDVPTSIIWGKQDCMIHWSHAFHAPGRVALHFFDLVGHLPQTEAPEEVAQIISRNF